MTIPGIYLKATPYSKIAESTQLLPIDTVLFDIEAFDMKDNAIYMSYRKHIKLDSTVNKVVFDVAMERSFIDERSA